MSKGNKKLRVLYSFSDFSLQSNPYVVKLVAGLENVTTSIFFSFRRAIFGRYDLVHLQWPEYVVKSESRTKRLLKTALCLLWIQRIRLTKIPVVYTVHNLMPHEKLDAISQVVLRKLLARVALRIYINESLENPADGITILHGMEPMANGISDKAAVGRSDLLFFGTLKQYKGIEDLVDAFFELPPSQFSLTIAGLGSDQINRYLTSVTSGSSNIHFIPGHVPEETLADLIESSNLVILPYRYFYNSGVAFASLEKGKRILIPRSESSKSLVLEFGSDQIRLFEQKVTSQDIVNALRDDKYRTKGEVRDRSWDTVSSLHILAYSAVARETFLEQSSNQKEALAELLNFTELRNHSPRNCRD